MKNTIVKRTNSIIKAKNRRVFKQLFFYLIITLLISSGLGLGLSFKFYNSTIKKNEPVVWKHLTWSTHFVNDTNIEPRIFFPKSLIPSVNFYWNLQFTNSSHYNFYITYDKIDAKTYQQSWATLEIPYLGNPSQTPKVYKITAYRSTMMQFQYKDGKHMEFFSYGWDYGTWLKAHFWYNTNTSKLQLDFTI